MWQRGSMNSFSKREGSYLRAGSMVSEGGLSSKEVGVLKKWVSDNEKEKKRRNIIIKGLDILKEIEKDGKERRRWVNEFIKERLRIECKGSLL